MKITALENGMARIRFEYPRDVDSRQLALDHDGMLRSLDGVYEVLGPAEVTVSGETLAMEFPARAIKVRPVVDIGTLKLDPNALAKAQEHIAKAEEFTRAAVASATLEPASPHADTEPPPEAA